MYGRDVVSVSVFERTKVRGKALEGGSMSIRSLCLFFLSFGLIARTRRAGRRSCRRDFVWVNCSYRVCGRHSSRQGDVIVVDY